MDNIIYFELNNWTCGTDYPNDEPYKSWMGNDLKLLFHDEEYVKENKLCVTFFPVDMSANFVIAAPKEWVDKNCPSLLDKYKNYILEPNEDGDIYSRFDVYIEPYNEDKIGIIYLKDPWYDDDISEDDIIDEDNEDLDDNDIYFSEGIFDTTNWMDK